MPNCLFRRFQLTDWLVNNMARVKDANFLQFSTNYVNFVLLPRKCVLHVSCLPSLSTASLL